MKKYLAPACLLLASNEILSLFALTIIAVMVICDMAGCMERGKY